MDQKGLKSLVMAGASISILLFISEVLPTKTNSAAGPVLVLEWVSIPLGLLYCAVIWFFFAPSKRKRANPNDLAGTSLAGCAASFFLGISLIALTVVCLLPTNVPDKTALEEVAGELIERGYAGKNGDFFVIKCDNREHKFRVDPVFWKQVQKVELFEPIWVYRSPYYNRYHYVAELRSKHGVLFDYDDYIAEVRGFNRLLSIVALIATCTYFAWICRSLWKLAGSKNSIGEKKQKNSERK